MEAEVSVLLSHTETQLNSGVDYSPCGQYVVASAGRTVVVLNVESRECIKRLAYHKAEVSVVKFITSSKFVSASFDSTIAVWDWDCTLPSAVLLGHSGVVRDLALSKDDSKLFSVSDDFTMKVWKVTGGGALESFPRIKLCATVQGDVIAFGTAAGRVRVLHLASREVIFESDDQGKVTTLEVSPNGRHLAFVSQDNTVHVLRIEDWQPIWEAKVHLESVGCISFSPDSQLLASGPDDGSMRMWNVLSEESYGVVTVYQREVGSISFSPNGARIVSGSRDGIVRWKAFVLNGCWAERECPN